MSRSPSSIRGWRSEKPHSFSFILLESSRINEIIYFAWEIYYEKKSLLKPLEIAILTLKIINFWYDKVLLWITPITKVKKVLTILIESLIAFRQWFFLKNHRIWLSYASFCIMSSRLLLIVKSSAISRCNSWAVWTQ